MAKVSCGCRVARAGPRQKIYFDPEEVNAAIVTCGGLCPGLNDVIRQVIMLCKMNCLVSDLISEIREVLGRVN